MIPAHRLRKYHMKLDGIKGAVDKDIPKIKRDVKYHAPAKKKTSGSTTNEDSKKKPDLAKLIAWKNFAKQAAQRKHWEMFVIDQFLRGNHSVKGDPSDNSITIVKTGDRIDYPINKIWSTFRAVRGFVTRHKPKVTVDPENTSEAAIAYTKKANKILERDNQLNNFRKINKEWVYYGVKYGVGYRQVGYDQVNQRCIRWSIDPFDLWIGSKTGEFEDAPFIVKSVVRTVGYLRNKYKDKDITADNELAADEFKKMSLQLQYPSASEKPGIEDDEQTALAYECWYRVFDKNSKGGTVNKCTFTDTEVLDFEETPYNDYPFIAYKSDITPNEVYAEGHLKHIIAPQRMLNLLNTQVMEYNHLTNRGRYMMDKNSGFKLITTKEGQIILRNPGKQITALPIPSLNQLIQWQMGFASDMIQDIGGQQDASTGRLPSASVSGDAIEALQAGDSNNIADLRDNFEDALAEEAVWILRMYSLFEADGVTVDTMDEKEEPMKFKAYGGDALKSAGKELPEKAFNEVDDDYVEAVAILPDNQVKVSVTSELGETKAARLDLLERLVGLGLPLKLMLENIEFPNASDVMERIASEAVADLQAQSMMASMGPQPGMPPEGAVPAGEPAVEPPLPPLPQQ